MKRIFSIFVIVGLFLCSIQLNAQETVVKGKVISVNEEILTNVQVRVKSSKESFPVDSLGFFTVTCANKDKLKIQCPGYGIETVKINGPTDLLIIKLKKTGIDYTEYATVERILEALKSNMEISRSGIIFNEINAIGEPCGPAYILINGIKSDAFSLLALSPDEIELIEIKKADSNAIARYGTDAKNGAIIVKTKKAK